MSHSITKEQYINDPCGVSSIAYWKNAYFQKLHSISLLHEKELPLIDQNAYSITKYFRLLHTLKAIPHYMLNDNYYFQTVDNEAQIEITSDLINRCYDDIGASPDQVKEWTTYPVFDNDLWVFICEKASNTPVALGIADYDSEIKEGSLEWIQVLPEKRGLGLGQALVCELLRRLKNKADFVTVSGQLDNTTNPESLYRKCGFTGNDVWCVLQSQYLTR